MVNQIVTPKANQLVNANCALPSIDSLPPKGRRPPCTRRGNWLLFWNGILLSESQEMAEILASLMSDSNAMKIGALLLLALLIRVSQFQLDRIKGDRGMEYLRVKLQF